MTQTKVEKSVGGAVNCTRGTGVAVTVHSVRRSEIIPLVYCLSTWSNRENLNVLVQIQIAFYLAHLAMMRVLQKYLRKSSAILSFFDRLLMFMFPLR